MKIVYRTGAYDILRSKDLQNLDKEIQMSKENDKDCIFALGIYDDNLCQMLGMNKPIKSVEDRVKIMEQIRGVDFAFSIPTTETGILEARLREAYIEYQKRKEQMKDKKSKDKKYKVGYAPGTYDLFHLGHLENILEAASKSEFLIVGVKDDELVMSHKNKYPIISAEERIEILRHFKVVNDVYRYYVRDLHMANEWIKSKYGSGADAVFLGSDLEKDFADVRDINIVFTERPPELMKTRSSTALRTLYLGSSEGKKYVGKDVRSYVVEQNETTKKEQDSNEREEL